jgi:ribose transport system permease protein
MIISGLARPGFFEPSNLLQLARGTSFFGIIALGMVFMLSHGDVDLSVGSNYYVSAVVVALAMVSGLNPWLAAGLGVLSGFVLGLLNGIIAILVRIPVLIVTLGTLSAYRGLGLVLSHTADVVTPHAARSGSFFMAVKFDFLDLIPTPVMIFFVLAVILQIVLNRTRFGLRLKAIGSNSDAARLLGIPITQTRILATGLVGICVGLVSVLTVGFFGSVNTMLGAGNELLVVSAVIIGGTPLTGGKGTVIGALIGALVISVISSSIVQLGVGAEWSSFVTGSVVVVAVALDRAVQHRREAR